jgi:aminoglycoside phosphotransferase (APT) family kinase protein
MKPGLSEFDELSPEVLQWVADAVGPATTFKAVRRLSGATSSELHRLEVARGGRSLVLVLRRFTNSAWLAAEPDLALHEATALIKAAEARVPTPELIAYDEQGEHCGAPAVLMTHLAGRVELKPADLHGWLFRQAEVLLPIHALEGGAFPWRYAPYYDVSRLKPPGWSRHPDLWAQAIDIVNGPPPAVPACFIHRDYHPTNVLWQDGRVSGVVDWVNACRGPANIDVAWCRGNLVRLFGVDVADRFLDAYRSLAGSYFQYHPHWDLMVILEVLPGPLQVYPPWIDFGVRHLTPDLIQERVDDYLTSVLARSG